MIWLQNTCRLTCGVCLVISAVRKGGLWAREIDGASWKQKIVWILNKQI